MPRTPAILLALLSLSVLGRSDDRPPDPFPDYRPVLGWPRLPAGVELGPVSAVATDAQDRVYVAHRGPKPVLVFDRDGTFLRSWGDDHLKTPHGLRTDPDGNVWVTDLGHHLVLKFDPDGKLLLSLGTMGRSGNTHDRFDRPTDVAVTPAGDFYVTDGYGNARVLKFDRAGKLLKQWGTKGTGEGQFHLPHAVVLDAEGRVYVGDRENDRVQVFDPDGKFLAKWKESGAPYGLFRAGDRTFVADGRAGWVRVLGPDGKPLGRFGGPGGGAGRFRLPHMLCVDSCGDVYVAEVDGRRVQKFTARPAPPPAGLTADDARQVAGDLADLTARFRGLRGSKPLIPEREDLVADAAVFAKGVEWALRYEPKLEPADVALLKKALARGAERAAALAAGNPAWSIRRASWSAGS